MSIFLQKYLKPILKLHKFGKNLILKSSSFKVKTEGINKKSFLLKQINYE